MADETFAETVATILDAVPESIEEEAMDRAEQSIVDQDLVVKAFAKLGRWSEKGKLSKDLKIEVAHHYLTIKNVNDADLLTLTKMFRDPNPEQVQVRTNDHVSKTLGQGRKKKRMSYSRIRYLLRTQEPRDPDKPWIRDYAPFVEIERLVEHECHVFSAQVDDRRNQPADWRCVYCRKKILIATARSMGLH